MLVEDFGDNTTWEHVEAQAKRIQQMNPAVFQAAFRPTPLLKVDQAHTKVGVDHTLRTLTALRFVSFRFVSDVLLFAHVCVRACVRASLSPFRR